jgi:crotonobetainyl-CoA:carnitine CoA-transferase CaiB-like acyl-CoA transferase
MSGKFLHLNRNKRSLALDLKKPGGKDALRRLLEKSDVLVWNIRPPAMARLGLSYEDVKAINPKIVYVGMFGFGQDGRYRDKPAYDSIIQGSGGVAALNHMATGEPLYLPIVMADRTVGLIATQMILMALFHREKTGEGASIQIPMFENMAKYVLEEHMYLKTFDPPLGPIADPRLMDPNAKPLKTTSFGGSRLTVGRSEPPATSLRLPRLDRANGHEPTRPGRYGTRARGRNRRIATGSRS